MQWCFWAQVSDAKSLPAASRTAICNNVKTDNKEEAFYPIEVSSSHQNNFLATLLWWQHKLTKDPGSCISALQGLDFTTVINTMLDVTSHLSQRSYFKVDLLWFKIHLHRETCNFPALNKFHQWNHHVILLSSKKRCKALREGSPLLYRLFWDKDTR